MFEVKFITQSDALDCIRSDSEENCLAMHAVFGGVHHRYLKAMPAETVLVRTTTLKCCISLKLLLVAF